MILAHFIGMTIMFIPAIIVATVSRSIISGLVTPLTGATGWTDFEVAIALLIPYMILVWLAIIRPIVNFWRSVRHRDMPRGE